MSVTQSQSSAEVRILPNAAAIARRAAERLVEIAAEGVRRKGSFELVLSGGSTPKALHTLLVSDPELRSKVPWDKMHLFFGDERHVKPDDPRSNYRMALETLISKSPLKPEQIHRIKAEYPIAEDAAKDYERQIRAHFKLAEGEFPRFDLVLLGMGSEGHTASLFPGTKALQENRRIVVHNWVGKVLMDRITLTAPALNNAGFVLFMVTGADKCLALTAVLERAYEPEQLPAQLIRPLNGSLLWLVDTAAGSQLTHAIRE
ncbi:MAG TPA: 6-phosphogluconolactonase [Candidatus Solibacter sp.]|nr:6-phosphogluconolactonase [Candidatus Solibacter sp.]